MSILWKLHMVCPICMFGSFDTFIGVLLLVIVAMNYVVYPFMDFVRRHTNREKP